MIRKLSIIGFSVAIALLHGPFSTSANASMQDSGCESGVICAWPAVNYAGQKTYWDWTVNSGDCVGFYHPYLSLKHHRYVAQRFWENDNCTGRNVLLFPGSEVTAFEFGVLSEGGI
ncbi:hypothetical protein ACWED2_35530 [Amycolatopsis sp. NPDC005003]